MNKTIERSLMCLLAQVLFGMAGGIISLASALGCTKLFNNRYKLGRSVSMEQVKALCGTAAQLAAGFSHGSLLDWVAPEMVLTSSGLFWICTCGRGPRSCFGP